METFFKVKTTQEVYGILDRFGPCGPERVPLRTALGRVLGRDVVSSEDLPDFNRSTVDGYAVRATDTFGASESLPALLEVVGEVLMGEAAAVEVQKGQAVKIATGGMLPINSNGVVMVEHTHLVDDQTLEVNRTISPYENVIQPGDDFKRGETVLEEGHLLRAQDLGALAGIGQQEVVAVKRPVVGIISTGDEMIAINESPRPGQIRDVNRYTLGALCERCGAQPVFLGLCPDEFEALRSLVELGLDRADTVWISGGSSVGTRDLTLRVLETFRDFELLVHGIAISPGKPTIIGRAGDRPVIGLPGHVASAMVVAEVFLKRLIWRLSGRTNAGEWGQTTCNALLSRNIESKSGREDYVRVRLIEDGERLTAEPIFGKSGLISPLVEAQGLVRVDLNMEGLYQGQVVKVMLFDNEPAALNRVQ